MQYVVDPAFEVCSYVKNSLINEDATEQSSECPQESGKQGTMFMNETKSSSKDDEASLQEDGGRETMLPPLNNECTPMIKDP